MTPLTRRDLLTLGALALFPRPPYRYAAARDDLDAWLRDAIDPEAVAAAAKAYRAKYPAESTETIRREVLAGLRKNSKLAEHLRRKVRDDFRSDRVDLLDGWVLSRTEGRLLALTSDN